MFRSTMILTLTLAATAVTGPSAAASEPIAGSADVCTTSIPGLGPATAAAIPASSEQVAVAASHWRRGMVSTFTRWTRSGACWTASAPARATNGARGCSKRPTTGSDLSPIGVFSLTSAGGRLRNPGTAMPYDYSPSAYAGDPSWLYNYVVAINFNRNPANPPRLNGGRYSGLGAGYWIHQKGRGVTRGCIGLDADALVSTLRWLRPKANPHIVMGPAAALAR